MAKEISGLGEEATKCLTLLARGCTVEAIAKEKGLSVQQVELRISRARMSRTELTDSERLTDVSAILDDVTRRCYEILHWEQELKTPEHIAVLGLVADTAMKKAELYGLATGESDG